ncbi:MAG: hypothetical protein M1828_003044 [Chrysothrix sp. TS-e1954]|nr:MAG: hypothetical protein M1828_003044 [Chrysothrix sp. TS-e1954]
MPSTLHLPTPADPRKYIPSTTSLLSVPTSPQSPLSPLSPKFPKPIHMPPTNYGTRRKSSVFRAHPAPSKPLPWRWQCHVCLRCYDIGITRRCLDDGHVFCSGGHETTLNKNSSRARAKPRRSRRHTKACASEFDYEGWKTWGNWRHEVEVAANDGSLSPPATAGSAADDSPRAKKQKTHKQCHRKCDYPSHCRWGPSFEPGSGVVPSAPGEAEEEEEEIQPKASKADLEEADITAQCINQGVLADDDDGDKPLSVHLAEKAAEEEAREARAEADKQETGAKKSSIATSKKEGDTSPRKVPTSFEEILGLDTSALSTRKPITREDLEDPDGDYDEYGNPVEPAEADDDDESDGDAGAAWDDETLYSLADDDEVDDPSYDPADDIDNDNDWSTVNTSSTRPNSSSEEDEEEDVEVPTRSSAPPPTLASDQANKPSSTATTIPRKRASRSKTTTHPRGLADVPVLPRVALIRDSEGPVADPLCYARSYDGVEESGEVAGGKDSVSAQAQRREEGRRRGKWRHWFGS